MLKSKNLVNVGERSEQDEGIFMLTIRLCATYKFLNLTVETSYETESMLKFENNFDSIYQGCRLKHPCMEMGKRERCCA